MSKIINCKTCSKEIALNTKSCPSCGAGDTDATKGGNQIGTALANVNNLEKDGTWKFKALGMDVDGEIDSYKLAEITGY